MSVLVTAVFMNPAARGEPGTPLPEEGGGETVATDASSLEESTKREGFAKEDLSKKAEEILGSFAHEPSLEDLKRAALQFQDADEERARGWRRAPNLAALLPVFKVVVDHDLERDETLDRRQDEPDAWGVDTDRDWGFQMSAQWHFGGLVFHSDEIRIWNALADRASRREAVLALLLGYYYERRRVQLELRLKPPETVGEIVERKLRIAELTASIDALTGGALSAGLEKKK